VRPLGRQRFQVRLKPVGLDLANFPGLGINIDIPLLAVGINDLELVVLALGPFAIIQFDFDDGAWFCRQRFLRCLFQ